MLNPKERYRLWKIDRSQRVINRIFDPLLKQARKDGAEEYQRTFSEYLFEQQMLEEEIDEVLTRNMIGSARKLRVMVPPYPEGLEHGEEAEHWRRGQYTDRYLLTEKGYAVVRDAIREERKARQELNSHWVTWIAAATGLIGAITGLVAVLAT